MIIVFSQCRFRAGEFFRTAILSRRRYSGCLSGEVPKTGMLHRIAASRSAGQGRWNRPDLRIVSWERASASLVSRLCLLPLSVLSCDSPDVLPPSSAKRDIEPLSADEDGAHHARAPRKSGQPRSIDSPDKGPARRRSRSRFHSTPADVRTSWRGLRSGGRTPSEASRGSRRLVAGGERRKQVSRAGDTRCDIRQSTLFPLQPQFRAKSNERY